MFLEQDPEMLRRVGFKKFKLNKLKFQERYRLVKSGRSVRVHSEMEHFAKQTQIERAVRMSSFGNRVLCRIASIIMDLILDYFGLFG